MEKCLNEYIDDVFDRLVSDAQELIAIESTLDEATAGTNAPFGRGIRDALEHFLTKAEDMGFYTKNLEGYAGYAQMGDSGDLVAVLAHLDVVPAIGKWIVPPYSAQIIGNKLYGRGSVDDKGPAIACLYAMQAIRKCGLPFTKRLRLILGTDEETLARGIHYYLEQDEVPAYGFSPDAEFPIIHAEKGTLRFQYHLPAADNDILSINAGTRLNVVPDRACTALHNITAQQIEKCACSLSLKSEVRAYSNNGNTTAEVLGTASHACYPAEGVNAIQDLLLLLRALYPHPDSDLKKALHSLAGILKTETDGYTAGLACSDTVSGSLTLNTAIMEVDKAGGICKFDIRYPVTHNGDLLIRQLTSIGRELDIRYETIQHKPPLYVQKDAPFIKELQKAYEEYTGEQANCISIGGGTYCRYISNTVSFGPVFPGQKELAHQTDEYISLEDLKSISKIYAQAIYNLIR